MSGAPTPWLGGEPEQVIGEAHAFDLRAVEARIRQIVGRDGVGYSAMADDAVMLLAALRTTRAALRPFVERNIIMGTGGPESERLFQQMVGERECAAAVLAQVTDA
jgi:hypothetical protein